MRKSLLLFLILALTTAFAAPAKTIEIGFTSANLSNAPSKLGGDFFEITAGEATLMVKGLNGKRIKQKQKYWCIKCSQIFLRLQ